MESKNAVLLPPEYNYIINTEVRILDIDKLIPSLSVKNGLRVEEGTFEQITIKVGVLETTNYLRDILKKIDYLLNVNGKLIVEYITLGDLYSGGHYTRPVSFFLYEFSLALRKRYKLIEKRLIGDNVTNFTFIKVENKVYEAKDSIDCWTFGIVSDGKKNDRIKNIINQIENFNIPNFEIIVCGPKVSHDFGGNHLIKLIDDSDLYTKDVRIPITAKKNRILKFAEYENIVLMHDRISFHKDWFERFRNYGNNFEVLALRILDEETQNLRVQDWMHYERDFWDFSNTKSGLLDYNDWNPTVYLDGGLLIAKKSALLEIGGYNEALNWGEAEDVDLAIRLYQAGFMTNLDLNNFVLTQTHRHKGKPLIVKSISYWRRILREFRRKIRLRLEKSSFDAIKKSLMYL